MPPRQPLLTAAMIVRNETEHLDACLTSISGVVDEIVVVDTGSDDETVAIAQRHGARVLHAEWTGDFSAARNVALDHAAGRWILYIDADERLRPVDRAEVRERLEHASEVALRVLLRPFVGATPAREFRLWRSDPRIRFVGLIHEKVVPAIQAVAGAEARSIGTIDLEIDHVGYELDQTAKHLRNLPLLEAQLAIEPRNVFNRHHYAKVLAALGRADEAEQALEDARGHVRRNGGAPPHAGELVYADLVRLRAGHGDVTALLDEGLGLYPHAPLLLWAAACIATERGDFSTALESIQRLAATDVGALPETMSYDERLFTVLPHQAWGSTYFRMGRYRDAADAYRAAEHAEPENPEHRLRRLTAEHFAGDGPARRVVEIAGIPTALHTSDRARTDAVDAVCSELRATGSAPVFEIDFTSRPAPVPPGPWPHTDGDVRARWHDGDCFLAHRGITAHVGATTARIGGDGDLARAFRQLFPYAIAHLLAGHDCFVLHGGAVRRGDSALLVLGGTGSGKSTVVVSALGAGWAALGDDLVAVRLGAAGPEVTGIAKPLHAPDDIARSLRFDPRVRLRPLPGDARRRHRVVAGLTDPSWYRVDATVVASHGARPGSVLERLTTAETATWLLHSFLARHEPTRLRDYLTVAAELTRRGGYNLRLGTDPLQRVIDVPGCVEEARLGVPPRDAGTLRSARHPRHEQALDQGLV